MFSTFSFGTERSLKPTTEFAEQGVEREWAITLVLKS
jgi:hypothetical protein